MADAYTFVCLQVAWQGPKWELAVACGTLQSGRTDWLIEKCTELGAWSFRPVLTERSPGIGAVLILLGILANHCWAFPLVLPLTLARQLKTVFQRAAKASG